MRNRASVRRDKRGLMELPFKLFIMIILISATMSMGIISFRNMQRSAFEQHVKDELNGLIFLSHMISREGNLSSQEMVLDLSGDMFAGIDQIRFGDRVGGRTDIISYSMDWREQREIIHLRDDIHLTSSGNSSFTLRSGLHNIRLTCLYISDDTTVVIVSRAGERIDYSSFYSM